MGVRGIYTFSTHLGPNLIHGGDSRLDSWHWTVGWTHVLGLESLEGNDLLGLESSSLQLFLGGDIPKKKFGEKCKIQ